MRFRPFTAAFMLIAIATAASSGAAELAVPRRVEFNRDVRPILSDNCFHCHGPDKNARQAELRLDIRDEALKAAGSGEMPIVPGKSDKSELVRRINSADADEVMPPADSHKTLTARQKEVLSRWITQ